MPDFHLAFTLKTVVIVLAVPAAVLVAAWAYRYTVPPVSTPLKIALITLRSLAVLFLFLLLGEPLLSLLTRSVEEPIVAILVDNSRSMSIQDRRGDRKKILNGILESPSVSALHSIGKPAYILFDRSSRFISSFSPESLTTKGDGTDIGEALNRLRKMAAVENIQAAVLLTDGQFTTGTSPLYQAKELSFPVFTVGIGDSTEQKDLQIRRVLANDIAYVGDRVPVNVTVKSTGFNGERVEVGVSQNGTLLDHKTLTLEPGTREYAIPLSVVPAKEGVQKFTVSVSKLPGELTAENNAMSFFTKVLKSKMKVLLVCGSPGEDASFIRRALEGDKNVDLKSFFEQKNGGFLEGVISAQVVSDADCLVLVGFPNKASSGESFSAIHDAITKGKPFLFVLSRSVDFDRLRTAESALPFTVGQTTTNEDEVFVTIPAAQQGNPILKISNASIVAWSKLAPVFSIQSGFRAKPEAEVLGIARIQSIATPEPVLVSRSVNRQKSFAILAYGIWRWKMFGDPANGTENLLDEFLSNTVRWLTTHEDDRQFRVQPVKTAFGGQEPIEFAGQLYDQSYKPVDNAVVQVTVARGKESSDILLNAIGNGRYDGSLDRLEEGDYSFSATAQQNGKTIAEDKGTFSVGGLNVEYLDTRMNKPLLEQIAASTGGKYYDTDALASLPNDLGSLPNFKKRDLVHSREIELWNFKWALALIVVLFSLEWFLRKRSGMI
ncbi:MAG TPA: vWA domain-containing protein [Bacteroidota bacterium]